MMHRSMAIIAVDIHFMYNQIRIVIIKMDYITTCKYITKGEVS